MGYVQDGKPVMPNVRRASGALVLVSENSGVSDTDESQVEADQQMEPMYSRVRSALDYAVIEYKVYLEIFSLAGIVTSRRGDGLQMPSPARRI